VFLLGILSIQCKPDAIDQVTLGDQPVNAINLFATLVYLFATPVYISFWLEL